MKTFVTVCMLLSWLMAGVAAAQTPTAILTGRVLDAKTQQPLPFATVYLNNTSRGTTADQNGVYRLTNVPLGNQELVGSVLGYRSAKQPLRLTDIRPRTVDLTLEPSAQSLAAVTVTARHNSAWVRQFRLFSRELLGSRPQARQCRIINENSLSFSDEKGHFRAQASEPLVIENRALGYRLTYDLLYFDLHQGRMQFAGTSHFDELPAADGRQRAQWQASRLKAYKGSLHHLLASLQAGTHEQEGYVVYRTPLALNPGTTSLPLVRTTERQRISAAQATPLFKPGELAFERRLVSDQPLEVYYDRVYAGNSPYRDSPYAYSMLLLPGHELELTTDGWITRGNGLDVRGYLGDDRLATLLPADWTPADKETIPEQDITSGRVLRADAGHDSLLAENRRQGRHRPPPVFVHTDKWLYATGDNIWLSGYVLDPARHLPVAGRSGAALQVELIAPGGRSVAHQWLRLTDGRAAGSFRLADTLAAGTYRLRAYTTVDTTTSAPAFECAFPVYNVRLPSLTAADEPPAAGQTGVAALRAPLPASPDVQFLAEGGRWLAGVPGKLGIKAIQANGHGRAVSGRLVDKAGAEVGRFTTNSLGMGHVVLTPQVGQRYTAIVDPQVGVDARTVALPAVEPEGWSLSADAYTDSTRLSVTVVATGREQQQPVYVTLQARDQLVYHQKWQLTKGEARFILPTATVPPGVCRLTVWDHTGKARTERLVFVPERVNPVQMKVIMGKFRYAPRENMAVSFRLHAADNYPVAALWSAAVTDADQLPDDTARSNLRTYLLLTGGLRGTVESPSYYLEAGQLGAIDDLLLTQGWRRLPATLPADSTGGWSISGHVRDRRGRPMVSVPVALSLEQDGQQGLRTSITDAQGRFRLGGLMIDDTVRVRARAIGPGGSGAVVTFDAPGAIGPVLALSAPDWQPLAASLADARIRQAAFPAFYRDTTARLLAEVIVRAAKPAAERPLDVQRASLHGDADGTLVVTREIAATCATIGDLFAKVPGLNQLYMRNYISSGDNTPLFIIDGVYAEIESVQSLNPLEVSRIELLKNVTTAGIYGARAANGVIAIYTRKGDDVLSKPTSVATTLIGFATPREFYVPRYDQPGAPPDADRRGIDRRDVLFWKALGQTGSDGLATLLFPVSDTAQRVRLNVQGVTTEGVPVSFTWVLPVR